MSSNPEYFSAEVYEKLAHVENHAMKLFYGFLRPK